MYGETMTLAQLTRVLRSHNQDPHVIENGDVCCWDHADKKYKHFDTSTTVQEVRDWLGY